MFGEHAESFFGTLKNEMYSLRKWATREEACNAVIRFIEYRYNRHRPHSAIGNRVSGGMADMSKRGGCDEERIIHANELRAYCRHRVRTLEYDAESNSAFTEGVTVDFSNEVFIVTGSSSGIGRSCAEHVIEAGGIAVGIDIGEGVIESGRYEHVVLDVTDEAAVEGAVESVIAKYARVDGLVNAAGIWGCGKPFFAMSEDEFKRALEVNAVGTFLMSKHVSRAMIPRRRGKIVNVSCIRASIFRGSMADYAASKGAVSSMTSAMALDIAPHGIQVNAVAPGFTYTGMTSASFDDPEVRAHSEGLIPLGRLGEPRDISSVVMFLLSGMSDYMTGTTVFADGGFHIQK